MDQLFDQLDLEIYASPYVSWWSTPLVIMGVFFALVLIVFGVWFIKHYYKKTTNTSVLELLSGVLRRGIAGIKQGRISPQEGVFLVISILKSYTAWFVKDKSVRGLTDMQWIELIKSLSIFKPYAQEVEKMILEGGQVKFNYGQVTKKQAIEWLERALVIIAEVNAEVLDREKDS
jgi:hypothetical protein